MFDQRLPPSIERHLDDTPAESLDRIDLGLWCMVRHHNSTGDAKVPGAPRDPLCHVAGARRVGAAGEAVRVGAQHGVRRATKLEGTNRLEVLELEPDLAGRVGD